MSNTQWGWYPQPQLPQPNPQRKQTLTLVLILVSVALLICVVIGGVFLYSGSFSRLLLSIEPTCTLGVTGTAATLTIEGWSANSDCSAILSGQPNFLNQTDPSALYNFTGTPTNSVVCEVDDQGRHVIVRDEGSLKIVGNSICQYLEKQVAQLQLQQQQEQEGITPTATPVPLESCTLQVTYHDMTMTIIGSQADQDCNDILIGSPSNFLGQIGINFYDEGIYEQPNPAPLSVVCDLTDQGREIVIRDDGGQYYGTKYCGELGQ